LCVVCASMATMHALCVHCFYIGIVACGYVQVCVFHLCSMHLELL